MSIFDIFKGASKRYIGESSHEQNLEGQLKMALHTLEELRASGVSDETKLQLEYFFTTNAEDKAERLVDSLVNIGYSPEKHPSPDKEEHHIVKGLSNPVEMSKDRLLQWISDMCILGFEEDCLFDKWVPKN
jgi:hypothetical protein